MQKNNILIYNENGFFYGSLEKLLLLFAKILSKDFNVYLAYGRKKIELADPNLDEFNIHLLPFNFESRQDYEPYALRGMQPNISEIIKKYNIHCVYVSVFAHYQFPINCIPASVPLVLISPFGHYSTNGNVYKTYVSGKGNWQRLVDRGASNPEVLFNPLEDFKPEFIKTNEIGEQVIFGRIGRGEDTIFDPISLRAFKKLEDKYGDKVKYIVVNPPPAWEELSKTLGVKNEEFREPITDPETLGKFYAEIDVLAHSRKDGETVGMAIAEAMLSGHPILTHKSHFHNDHFDILNESYAKWCEPDDVETYYQNLVWMVENKNQIRKMGQLARARALEIFSVESQAPKIVQTFQDACEKYYNDTQFGKIKGRAILYAENFKNFPFWLGKLVTYKFPGMYKSLRKLYYK